MDQPLRFWAFAKRTLARRLPVVLPHRLVEWLVELDLMHHSDREGKGRYWKHLASRLSWAKEHVEDYGLCHEPIYLWGDDAQYNERLDKLVVVSMGFVLDKRPAAESVYPLFCYRCDTRINTINGKS